jgi:hypothetical protein
VEIASMGFSSKPSQSDLFGTFLPKALDPDSGGKELEQPAQASG